MWHHHIRQLLLTPHLGQSTYQNHCRILTMPSINVLIIDDCPTSTAQLVQELASGGFAVTHHRADNAGAVRALLNGQDWNLVLSKPVLPQLNCFFALKLLKRQRRDVPFIVVSDSTSEEMASMAMMAGAHDYVERNQARRLRLAMIRVLREAETRREQRRAEQALRTAHQRMIDTLESLPDAIFILDETNRVIVWNRSCEELTGVSRREMLGKGEGDYAIPFFGKPQPMLVDCLETPLDELAMTWEHASRIGNHLHATSFAPFLNQGRGAYLWTVAMPLHDREGRQFGAMEVIRDISEQHRLDDDFRKAQKTAAVGLLAAGLAHDFNNLLTVILMNLALLRDHPNMPRDFHGKLKELESETLRAARLTRQLLVFSRRQKLDVKPFEFRPLMDNFVQMLRRLIGENIDLEFRDDSRSAWVKADEGMMEQVVTNLCINARDAMPNGGRLTIGLQQINIIESSLHLHPKGHTGTFVCLSITDTGCGMDDATIMKVFEPFFSTKEAGKGSGLGLPTVCSILKQHHGWMEVESAVGVGSTFRVYVPLWTGPHEPDAASETPATIHGGTETILVVEDDASDRQASALCLRKLGYVVFEAASGVEALLLFYKHQSQMHLVVADMVMPGGMTGLELVERLMKGKRSLKGVISSGHDEQVTKPETFGEKGIAYLHKPYSEAALAKMVRECLDRITASPSDSGLQREPSQL